MPMRPCLGRTGRPCSRLTTRPDSRCEDCASARERARGNRHERGYGSEHDTIRADLLAKLVPGAACPRCGEPMWPTQDLDAGHPPDAPLRLDRTSRADHLEHSSCNRAARD